MSAVRGWRVRLWGAGKSTLVREIVEGDSAMARMRGDGFLDPSQSHCRSGGWDGVDRRRLLNEVLAPFREEREGSFRRYESSRVLCRYFVGAGSRVRASLCSVSDSTGVSIPREPRRRRLLYQGALHEGVVEGIADGADRRGDALEGEVLGQPDRGVLRSGVAVMDQVPW